MEYTVREAKEEDVHSLDILRRQAVEAGYSEVYERGTFAGRVAGEDPRLRGWIRSSSVHVLLVEHRFSPVCFGVFDPGKARILGLYTAPDHQRRGWARELVRRFEQSVGPGKSDSDAGGIEVKAPLNAVGFFRKLGFQGVDTVVEDGLELRWMYKSLSR